MRSAVFVLVLAGFLIQACAPIPSVPRVTATKTLAPRAAPTKHAGLEGAPLAVGYGVDGGWFQLYFTDPANAGAAQRSGGPDEALVAAMDSARLSIDAAIYSFSLDTVRRALVRAHRRGVVVRVVMESDNMDGFDAQALKDAGIPVLGDRREGLMHNKFLVVDRTDVWTGSMNMTDDGAYSDRNNLIKIRSRELASDYEAEFNEMFVDDRFGHESGTATPYPRVTVDGTVIEVYFSPDDHVGSRLAELLTGAQSSIEFLAYSFTSDPLGEAIRGRADAGVRVRGVMDADQVRTNQGTEYDRFRIRGLEVRLDGEEGLMHHKVLIIDRKTIVLGSYNFTASAEKSNDENVLVIHSAEIAGKFTEEFRRVYGATQP